VIGAHPNRSELTAIVTAMKWIPLGRSDKRVKALQIQKLEGARDRILPFLETAHGMKALENTYLAIVNRRRGIENPRSPLPHELPREATVAYYLNQHKADETSG
jgi:hypothetical protein